MFFCVFSAFFFHSSSYYFLRPCLPICRRAHTHTHTSLSLFLSLLPFWRAVIAQSVWRWATGWKIGVLGFDSRRELGIFLFTTASRRTLGPTQPPIQWVPGALSMGVKRLEREADHSHLVPRSKNEWSYACTPQYAIMEWCGA
jgi:hypothetical protein